MLTWAFLLLLAAAAQAQYQSQSLHPPKSAEIVSAASAQTIEASPHRRVPAGRSPAEIPLLKHDITTVKFRSTDDDASNHKVNALAPAKQNAVRAPSAQSAESSSDLSALTPARLLQNWEAENIVLLATIDGAIHARDRKTGQERWSLGIPDSPMIQTTHHCYNQSDDGEGQCDHDYIFIVEPSKDGSLYVQHKNPQIGLQRLGVTVRGLAEQTPQFVEEPPLVTIAEQETTAYVVDAASGNVLRKFGKQSTFVNDNQERSCRRLSGFELDDSACDPIGTINLGRVEYTITISNKVTGELLCTIKFAEWVPNTADIQLQQQYNTPFDSYHIQTYYNGRIQYLDTNSEPGKFHKITHKLETPVARIFDIVRPIDNKDDSANLVLLSRPMDSPLLSPTQHWRDDPERLERVFVNRTDAGVWYAMSELSYPGVTSGAAQALSHWMNYDSAPIDFENNMEDIIGVHVLQGERDAAQIYLTIDGRPPTFDLVQEAEKSMNDPSTIRRSEIVEQFKSNWSLVVNVVLLGLCLLFVGVQLRIPAILKLQRYLRKAGVEVAFDARQQSHSGTVSPSGVTEGDVPVAEISKPKEQVDEAVAEAVDVAVATPARSRTQSSVTAAASPKKEQKQDDDNENSSDGESDYEKITLTTSDPVEGADGGAEPKKRHAKRGKRGGKKNKKKKQMEPGAMDEAEALTAEVPTKEGLLQVGKLRIDTKESQCLGRGSNGTAVFPGTLDGREVAVKRLIRSSNSLAAKEIKHLLSSDENPHVIRYFGKEESQHFTYIALDLFTTSLDQFVERPLQYPSLVKMPEGFDVKDCLTQITDGVAHLHSLKLVHRDIKPQNVLVKAIKSSRPTVGLPKLHFVISDFGLCKPLEEGPESTFAPTANHTAAGTTGWRAPELLINYTSNATANTASTASTTHSNDGSTSASGTLDRPSRRATKAIDIFSLGCVFYYVMTQGRHPFDIGGTSLGRDLNIKENRFSTDDLRLYEYSFDADDLIMQMLKHDPRDRPDTAGILKHPYFWPVEDKLDFLCDVSDCYEKEKNSIKNIHDENAVRTAAELDALAELGALEALAPNVIGPNRDFLRALPKSFINEMGKQRKYTGSRMIDLLRVIRNKRNHFHDLPEDVKQLMTVAGASGNGNGSAGSGAGTGESGGKGLPSVRGYYEFWEKRFPSLLVNCHCLLVERGVVGGWRMERYF